MNTTDLLFDSFAREYETIGKLRFLRCHDLLGGELEEMERHQRKATVGMLSLMTLAKRISEAKQVPFEDVLTKLTNGDLGDDPIIAEFSEDIYMVVSGSPLQAAIESEMITLFIQSRAEIEGPNGWQRMVDWSAADTKRLPGRFRQEVLAFIKREQGGEQDEASGKGEPEEVRKGKPRTAASA